MRPDSETRAEPKDWSPLIGAIARDRDRAAFAAVFAFFSPRIKAFMLRSGMTDTRAEELAQETMLMVWRKAAQFDPATAGVAAWIFAIARNLRIDAYRREQRGGPTDLAQIELEFVVDEAPQPDTQAAAAHSEAKVRAALASLSAEQMRVVEMSFFEERAHPDIARALGIPLGTVKSRLRLAMNRLRTLLSDLA